MTDAVQSAPENITVGEWNPEKWITQSPAEGIRSLFAYVDKEASKAVSWYESAKRKKAPTSRLLRAFAIVLFVLGGLAPIVAGLVGVETADKAAKMVIITQSGYVVLGVAAGLLAFDRYFGFSSGWIRYMTSLATIERLRAEFLFDWTRLLQEAPATIDVGTKLKFLARAQAFQRGVSEIVEKETAAWVVEFQSSIADLEKVVQAQRQAAEANAQAATKQERELRDRIKKEEEETVAANRPGAVNIEIVGDEGGPYQIFVDGQKVQEASGRSAALRDLPKGQHAIEVRGAVDGKPISAAQIIKVEPGGIAQVKFTPS